MRFDQPGRILVVDDNAATKYATSRVLRSAGFEVFEAGTGAEALRLVTTEPIDLIVLDIDLPDIDGYEICRRIRILPTLSAVRVVYLSASFVEDSHRVQGFEAGADGFLTHPVEPAVLIAAVASLLRNRTIELQLAETVERERRAREDAERASRAKDDFLATLSHELRSPLTAIVGWAAVARIKAAQQPEVLNALNIITRNASQQARLIADLLDVSRVTAGKDLELDLGAMSLPEMVRDVVESSARAAEDRKIRLEVSIDETIDPIAADAGRLAQAVSNLISNAIKFSPPGGLVQVALTQQNRSALICVTDQGRGIRPQLLDRIFERFWQEDTSLRRSHGGLGLGLFIVSHIATRHGGKASAFSEGEGKGARFTIQLPLRAPGMPIVQMSEELPLLENGAIDLTGLKVLVVDDDTDAREWVRQIVAAAGAETRDVPDVSSAVRLIERFHPDVIVSDLAMPGQTGFDLVAALRTAGYSGTDLPIIALSAHASLDYERRALAADFQFFVPKPPEPQALVRLIRRATL